VLPRFHNEDLQGRRVSACCEMEDEAPLVEASERRETHDLERKTRYSYWRMARSVPDVLLSLRLMTKSRAHPCPEHDECRERPGEENG
jgi:hypothetical protein